MYITNQIKNKQLNIGIDGLISSITQSKDSHKGAWPRIIKDMLLHDGYSNVHILNKTSKWDEYDAIIIDLGMEFKGTFNLFGGANDEIAIRLEQYYNYKGLLFCYDKEFPSINEFIKSRYNSASNGFKALIDFDFDCKKVENIDHIYTSDKLILGDSHCISQYQPGWNINRNDGQTLYGFLKNDIFNYIHFPSNIDHLLLYFGNIDIRHHLCRQDNPLSSTIRLASDYIDFAYKLKNEYSIDKITLMQLLPIEDESRKVPKSGWHKGTPFYGSIEKRQQLVEIFNNKITKLSNNINIEIREHPESYKNDKGELDFEVMERPQSIHISPKYYIYDLDKKQVNDFDNCFTIQEVLF